MKRFRQSDTPSPAVGLPGVNKWDTLRNATAARETLGVGNRSLGVLSALLSFHRGEILPLGQPIIVFPSNRTLSDRAHGMPESTLRRHLALLIDAGLIVRHDSPNGKRYARRNATGEMRVAFGFDLSPLAERAAELNALAEQAREREQHMKEVREHCVLMLRDICGLIAELGVPEMRDRTITCQKSLRRKLDERALDALASECSELLHDLIIRHERAISHKGMGANHSENERHIQESKTEDLDMSKRSGSKNDVSIREFMDACPEIEGFSTAPIRTWEELACVASSVRSYLGIDDRTWRDSLEAATPLHAACVVAFMLQCKERVKVPSAYLRAMMAKVAAGQFDLLFMVKAARKYGRQARVDSCQLLSGAHLLSG